MPNYMYVYKATGEMVHSSRIGSMFHTKYIVPVEIFGWVQLFKIHWQAKMHKVHFFLLQQRVVWFKGQSWLVWDFHFVSTGRPVEWCGFHLLARFTVNIHEESWLLKITPLTSRPSVTWQWSTFAHPSLVRKCVDIYSGREHNPSQGPYVALGH